MDLTEWFNGITDHLNRWSITVEKPEVLRHVNVCMPITPFDRWLDMYEAGLCPTHAADLMLKAWLAPLN